jgi:hypothetical protein
MTNEDRRLIVETLGEMRQLKGEMKEFKEHVIGRVQTLEKKDGERNGNIKATLALILSTGMLAMNFIANFLTHGGK